MELHEVVVWNELASAIPSSYSRKTYQMVAHEIEDLYWFSHDACPSPVGGDATLLVFVCSVIGVAAPPSYVL
jgi:hypothetical protein